MNHKLIIAFPLATTVGSKGFKLSWVRTPLNFQPGAKISNFCSREEEYRKEEKKQGKRYMNGIMLQSAWKDNGIQKPFTHLCHSPGKGKKECPLKEQQKQKVILFFFPLGFLCACSLFPLMLPGRKNSVSLLPFIILRRMVYFMAMWCSKTL